MGYDLNRFQCEVKNRHTCPICLMVLEDPVETKCRHYFCKECINRSLNSNWSCPICREQLLPLFHLKPVGPFMLEALSELRIKCDFAEQGCPAVVNLGELEKHIIDCQRNPNRIVICNRGCGKPLCGSLEIEQHNCISHLKEIVDHQGILIQELMQQQGASNEERTQSSALWTAEKRALEKRIEELEAAYKRIPEERASHLSYLYWGHAELEKENKELRAELNKMRADNDKDGSASASQSSHDTSQSSQKRLSDAESPNAKRTLPDSDA